MRYHFTAKANRTAAFNSSVNDIREDRTLSLRLADT